MATKGNQKTTVDSLFADQIHVRSASTHKVPFSKTRGVDVSILKKKRESVDAMFKEQKLKKLTRDNRREFLSNRSVETEKIFQSISCSKCRHFAGRSSRSESIECTHMDSRLGRTAMDILCARIGRPSFTILELTDGLISDIQRRLCLLHPHAQDNLSNTDVINVISHLNTPLANQLFRWERSMVGDIPTAGCTELVTLSVRTKRSKRPKISRVQNSAIADWSTADEGRRLMTVWLEDRPLIGRWMFVSVSHGKGLIAGSESITGWDSLFPTLEFNQPPHPEPPTYSRRAIGIDLVEYFRIKLSAWTKKKNLIVETLKRTRTLENNGHPLYRVSERVLEFSKRIALLDSKCDSVRVSRNPTASSYLADITRGLSSLVHSKACNDISYFSTRRIYSETGRAARDLQRDMSHIQSSIELFFKSIEE